MKQTFWEQSEETLKELKQYFSAQGINLDEENIRIFRQNEYKHFDETKKLFVCPTCQRKYKELAAFKFGNHLKDFHVPRTCQRCNKSCPDRDKFNAHKRRCNKKINQ